MGKLENDPEYRQYWATLQNSMAYQDRGLFLPARKQLNQLRSHPRRISFDPHRSVDFSYAICLTQKPTDEIDVQTALDLLVAMSDDVRAGRILADGVQLLIEIASVLILQGDFQAAEERAKQAVALGRDHPLLVLAQQNLGRALFEQGRNADAEIAYRTMLNLAVDSHELARAGVAAEWLGRISLRDESSEAAASWRDLANDAYRTDAPRHLSSLEVFDDVAAPEMPRQPVAELGPDAVKLRDLVPFQNELGDRAGLHLDGLSIDLGALRLLAEHPSEETITWKHTFSVPIPEISNRLCDLIAAEANALLPHDWCRKVITDVTTDLWPTESDLILKRLAVPSSGGWSVRRNIFNGDLTLIWSTQGAGPAAYGTDLAALAELAQSTFPSSGRSTQTTNGSSRGVSLHGSLNLADRRFPRPVQSWVLSQSKAALGGTAGPLHLAEDSTRQRILSARANQLSFEKMKYTPEEIKQLHEGRLVAVLASEMSIPGGAVPHYIGTTPFNEVNLANPPASLQPAPDSSRPGLIIDREYNTLMWAPDKANRNFAWYGKRNDLFRDHFSEFHKKVEISGSLRAKHYAIPIIDVHDRRGLEEVKKLLAEAAERLKPTKHIEPDAEVWFRGQLRGYTLDRSELVNRYLFGRHPVAEPSLPGAAPRRGWNYLKVHSFLSTMLQARIYREADERGESFKETHERWKQFAMQPMSWDLGVMLLAQHYGIPTHGIDITNDLEVALWFATNRLRIDNGQATYRKVTQNEWETDPGGWPCLYAILPVTNSLKGAIQDVDLFRPFQIEALRPKMQSAAFFMGAHGLHRNRLAEALMCVIRLAPGEWNTACTYEGLFPRPEEDPSYAWLLGLKNKYRSGDIGKFLNEIPLYIR